MEPSTTRTNGIELAFCSHVPKLHELVAVLISQNRVVKVNLGETRYRSEDYILDARLRGGSDGNGITIAAKSGSHPYNMNIGDGGIFLRFATVRSRFCHGSISFQNRSRVSALLRRALGSGFISENVNSVQLLQARDTTLR